MCSFDPYRAANNKTLSPVIHISLNPHPDDTLTDDQFRNIAQEYMQKLGYGKQPYLIYKHEDISRRHIHIVSVCIDENGKKINDSFEKKRSDNIHKELEKRYNLRPAEQQKDNDLSLKPVNMKMGDVKKQVSNVAKAAMSAYRFQSITEYRALLSFMTLLLRRLKARAAAKLITD